MASDMVVALARSTQDGSTFFAHISHRPPTETPELVATQGGEHAPDDRVQATYLAIPQARHTWAILGARFGSSAGYEHGVNSQGVAIGWTPIHTRLREETPGLTGPDLVRLGLERAGSARQAVEVLTELISRHGQGGLPGGPDNQDAALLITDRQEACLLEAAGRHWVVAEVGSVRAVSSTCVLRQDWDRISRGLSDLAIERGWWPQDGCKLDFAGTLAVPGPDHLATLRRWGRAMLHLEQGSGQIDLPFVRRLLRELSEPAPVELQQSDLRPASALLVHFGPEADTPPIAWYGFGSPATALWQPLFAVGNLPPHLEAKSGETCLVEQLLTGNPVTDRTDPRSQAAWRAGLTELQSRLDTHAREFLPDAAPLLREGRIEDMRRLAVSFMQHCCERLEDLSTPPRAPEHQPAEQPPPEMPEEIFVG